MYVGIIFYGTSKMCVTAACYSYNIVDVRTLYYFCILNVKNIKKISNKMI